MALCPSCGTDNLDEAVPRLHEVREIFSRLGARPLVEEVDGHLQRATALTS
jgi:hypothetical protein